MQCAEGRGAPLARKALLNLGLATILVATALAPVGTAQEGSGIGVAPSTLRIHDPPLVRGGTMERTLSFQQHDYEVAEVEIRVLPPSTGTDASAWVTADPGGRQTVPRTSDYPVTLRIEVPEEAANGEYRAKVEFRVLQACDSQGSCAALQTAASSVLEMTVGGEEIKRIKVTGSPLVQSAEEGGSLQFSIPFENVGNVIADPHVRFEVQDKAQTKTLTTYWSNDTRLTPGDARTVTFIHDQIRLTPDQYWGVVSVYLGGVLVHTANPQTFQVLKPGSLSITAELKTIRIEGDRTVAQVGDLVKLTAVVANTGKAPLMARLKGEVYVDGALRDTIESDALRIPVGESRPLEVIYTVQFAGQHEFKGKVHYGAHEAEGFLSAERSLLLRAEGGADPNGRFVWLGGLGVLVLVALGAIVLVRAQGAKKRRRAPARRTGPPAKRYPPQAQRPPTAHPGRAPARPPQGRPQEARPSGPPRGPPRQDRPGGRPPRR